MHQLALDPIKKHAFHSAGGLGTRTPAQVDALQRYLLSAGTPRGRAKMIEAFQAYPGWGAGLTALYKRIGRKQMARELVALLQKPKNSLLKMITDIKMGRNGGHARDGLEAVKLYIIRKYKEKCAGHRLFR